MFASHTPHMFKSPKQYLKIMLQQFVFLRKSQDVCLILAFI